MKYDVLITGGGPAGLSAAFTAAKSGAKVAVFEKRKEIGYPVHTSGGSWIDELKALDIPGRFMHPIHEGIFALDSILLRDVFYIFAVCTNTWPKSLRPRVLKFLLIPLLSACTMTRNE